MEKRRKRTIYIDSDIDKQMRVAAVEDDKFYGEYAEEAFRLFLDKRRKEKKSTRGDTKSWEYFTGDNLPSFFPVVENSIWYKVSCCHALTEFRIILLFYLIYVSAIVVVITSV